MLWQANPEWQLKNTIRPTPGATTKNRAPKAPAHNPEMAASHHP
ncbi:MAG: hypothetical protein ACI3ZB_10445 [Prevotella sp.]